jgi:UDP-N-acetylmuramoylalanine--D-glutamate ligase
MIPVAGFEGQKVMVLGLGRSGLSAARALPPAGPRFCAGTMVPRGARRRRARG